MKKIVILFGFLLLVSLCSFALAENDSVIELNCQNHPGCANATANGTMANGCIAWVCPVLDNIDLSESAIDDVLEKEEVKNEIANLKDDIKELRQQKKELRGEIKAYLSERKELRAEIKGKNVSFSKDGDRIRLGVGNHSASTKYNITEGIDESNNTILLIEADNGQNKTIKIMPDTASERALERLRMKVCNETNNCTIELKDVGSEKVAKFAYELKAEKKSRVLGLFNKKMKVQSQVDSETGDVISAKKPWWAFLASEQN